MEYAFSWYTLTAVVIYFAVALGVYRYIRMYHPQLHVRFGGRRIWYSASNQMRFLAFLFGFQYFRERDTTLSLLALLMQLTVLTTAYLVFAQPISFLWRS
jgi:hypothetical protein